MSETIKSIKKESAKYETSSRRCVEENAASRSDIKATRTQRRRRKRRRKKLSPSQRQAIRERLGVPLTLSPGLANLLGEEQLPLHIAVKKLWAYIKKNNLQAFEDKRVVECDTQLKAIFHEERLSFGSIPGLLSRQLSRDPVPTTDIPSL